MFVIRNSLVSLHCLDQTEIFLLSLETMGWLARRPKMTLKYITYMLYRRVQRKYQPNRNKKKRTKRRNWKKEQSNDDEQEPNQMNRNKVNESMEFKMKLIWRIFV